MDDDVTREQRMLLDTTAQFIEKTCPMTKVRERVFDDPTFASAYRRQAGELGWYSLLVPEELGGGSASENGVVDAALIAYLRGGALQPDPFVGSNVVAYALASAGTDEQQTKVLPALMSGEATGSWLIAGGTGRPDVEGVVQAVASGDAFALSGKGTVVSSGGAEDWLLVTAEADGADAGPSQFLVSPGTAGVTFSTLESLDVTRHLVEVTLADVTLSAESVVGVAGGSFALVARQLAIACILTVAESLGAMDSHFNLALAYSKDRIAFGRPIGSFQAIKHLLADTSLNLEMGKAIAVAAANSVGADDYGLEAASIAKAFVGDTGIDLGQACFQIFGGIGFTWEHDQHLYLRRVTSDAALYGDPVWHRERLCQLAGL
jgi:alkylation response protein AidB-like acyl-CoA dehydrogenase